MPNTVQNIFDLLHVDGKDTRALPSKRRKRLLHNSFPFSDPLRYTTHRLPDGETVYRAACGSGDSDDLVYAGQVGTGFDTATLRSLHKRLARTEQDASPITRGRVRRPGVHWICPTLVAQVVREKR